MKQRVKEMEEEAAKLREMQAQVEKEMNLTSEGWYLFLLLINVLVLLKIKIF